MKALIATRKGLIELRKTSNGFEVEKVSFEGTPVHYASFDRTNKTTWACISHGHWGSKLHRRQGSEGEFTEVSCPAFSKDSGSSFKNFWAMESDKAGRVYIGSEPAALFHSDDLGESWKLNEALFKMEGRSEWMGGGTDESCLHSIAVDPANDQHLFLGVSCAGVIASSDRGESWSHRNKGLRADFLPDPTVEWGHDPHQLKLNPFDSRVLWQQNHCGLYKSQDSGESWIDLADSPGLLSDFGFAIACSDQKDGIVYTVPGVSDERRMAINGALCVQRTKNGGESFECLRKGLPQKHCFDIVYRHGLATKEDVVIFGSSTGNVYISYNEGDEFQELFGNLAQVYSVSLY